MAGENKMVAPSDRVRSDLETADTLRSLNESRRIEQWRTRSIMDGGQDGLRVLLGDLDGYNADELSLVPTANLMLAGIERFAHKLGRRPGLSIMPPVTKDTDRARKQAGKQERIVEHYDERDSMDMMLPQLVRWTVGYGYAPVVIRQDRRDGYGYPSLEMRDPYESFPGEFGVNQQPDRCAFVRTVPVKTLAHMYPHLEPRLKKLPQWTISLASTRNSDAYSGLIIGAGSSTRSWGNRSGTGVDVIELYDRRGIHVMVPDLMASLEFIPNPCDKPLFRFIKRFAFNDLRGHFEHVVGLASSMAKMNLLMQIAAEDSVFSETNVYSNEEDGSRYERGRDALNVLSPNARVERINQNVPFQLVQHVGMLERMLRSTSRYSAQADGESPNSFATGRGLEELSAGFDAEIREYFTALRFGLEALDEMRLSYDKEVCGGYRKPMSGRLKGDEFAEMYDAAKDIRTFKTRRTYGAMSGFDEPSKIATMLNLNQAGMMSRRTAMENLEGVESVINEEERVLEERTMQILLGGVESMAGQGDPKAMMALVDLMDSRNAKETLRKFFTPQEPQLSPEEEAMINPPPPPGPGPAPAQDIGTVLARSTDSGADLGVQRVGRIG